MMDELANELKRRDDDILRLVGAAATTNEEMTRLRKEVIQLRAQVISALERAEAAEARCARLRNKSFKASPKAPDAAAASGIVSPAVPDTFKHDGFLSTSGATKAAAGGVMERLFPAPANILWTQVDLNKMHISHAHLVKATKPIVADLAAQEALLSRAQRGTLTTSQPKDQRVCTYGGFGEDRDALWFGLKRPAIHLGVDFNNLDVGQSVRSLTDGTVLHVMRDTDAVNGWGGRVIIVSNDPLRYTLYGHLDHKHLPELGSHIKSGDEVGKIGASFENGGWFHHLHLQYMTFEYVEQFLTNLDKLDGYDSALLPGILDPMTIP